MNRALVELLLLQMLVLLIVLMVLLLVIWRVVVHPFYPYPHVLHDAKCVCVIVDANHSARSSSSADATAQIIIYDVNIGARCLTQKRDMKSISGKTTFKYYDEFMGTRARIVCSN